MTLLWNSLAWGSGDKRRNNKARIAAIAADPAASAALPEQAAALLSRTDPPAAYDLLYPRNRTAISDLGPAFFTNVPVLRRRRPAHPCCILDENVALALQKTSAGRRCRSRDGWPRPPSATPHYWACGSTYTTSAAATRSSAGSSRRESGCDVRIGQCVVTVIGEHLDSAAWWQEIQDLTETPIRDSSTASTTSPTRPSRTAGCQAVRAPSTAGSWPPGRIWPARPSRRWSTGRKAGSARCAPS